MGIHLKVYSKHISFRFTKLMIRTVLWLKLMRIARFQSLRMNAPVTHMKLSYHRKIIMKGVPKLDLCVLVTPQTMRKITKNASCEFLYVTLILMSTSCWRLNNDDSLKIVVSKSLSWWLSPTDRMHSATVMLVKLWCWWLTVGDNFRILVAELRSWWHLLEVGARR